MAYIYDLTDTWNAGGTTFNGIKLNVTDSASAVSSKLMTLQTNGTEHFSVTKAGVGYFSGNVGVGTSSPSSFSGYTSLTVNNATNGGLIEATNGTRTIRMQSQASGSALVGTTTSHNLGIMSAGVERVTVDTNGNLLAGVTSSIFPTGGRTNIEVNGSSQALFGMGVGNTGAAYFLHDGTNMDVFQSRNGYMRFGTNNTERMRIDSSGNVGIGTSTPAEKLTVQVNTGTSGLESGITLTNGVDANLFNYVTGTAATDKRAFITAGAANQSLTFGTLYTERMRIDASGNVLVGTTSIGLSNTNSLVLDPGNGYLITNHSGTASGTAYAFFGYNGSSIGTITQNGTTGVLYNTSSDVRLKENIADADDAASLIDAIQVRKFDWKSDGSHQRYGFVAQELLEVAPEAVSHDPDDDAKFMGVDYSKLVPMLVKEIQSLRARVAQLEGTA